LANYWAANFLVKVLPKEEIGIKGSCFLGATFQLVQPSTLLPVVFSSQLSNFFLPSVKLQDSKIKVQVFIREI
jgi:hypothetical protein